MGATSSLLENRYNDFHGAMVRYDAKHEICVNTRFVSDSDGERIERRDKGKNTAGQPFDAVLYYCGLP